MTMRTTPQRICLRRIAKMPDMTSSAAMIQRIVAIVLPVPYLFHCWPRAHKVVGR